MKNNSNDSGGLGFIVFLLAFVCFIAYYVWFLIVPIILGYYTCKLIYVTKSTTNKSLNSTLARTALQAIVEAKRIRKLTNEIRLEPENAYFTYGENILYQKKKLQRPDDPEYSESDTLEDRAIKYHNWKKLTLQFENDRKARWLKKKTELVDYYREIKY